MHHRSERPRIQFAAVALAACALPLLAGCSLMRSAPSGGPEATTIYSLDNGMRVVIREDHFSPVVAQQIWVQAGGADEADIEAGVAHVHEHMLFKGTTSRGVGEIAAQVESSGGRINAWTSWDQTVYHVVLASQFWAEGLDVLADSVRNSTFDPAELTKELGVVMEEYKRSKDSPGSRVFEALFAEAYRAHPYGRPVIGTEESITGLTRERILDFYRRFYTPENMTVVIVGDVDTAAVRGEIDKLFGDFDSHGVERNPRPVEPAQNGVRVANLTMDVQEAQMALGMHIPGATDPDAVALDVLAHILDGGESTRLYQNLVAERQLATSVSAYAYTPPDPGMFFINASFEADDEAAVLAALLEELERVREEPITQAELDRARANLESDFVYRRQTVQGQARELGYFVVVYKDPHYDESYVRALREVTLADVQRVARKYLTLDNLSVVTLLPEGRTSVIDKSAVETAAARLATDAPRMAAATEGAVGDDEDAGAGHHHRADAEATRVVLDNGVRVIIREHPTVPTFSVRVATVGGLLAETAATNGTANFVADVLTRGTEKRTHQQLAEAIENLAGDIRGFSGRSSMGVAATFQSKYFDEGMDLVEEVLLEPGLRATDVERARRELLLAIKNREDEVASQAFNLAFATVFPDHPYGMTVLGEKESVAAATPESLRDFLTEVMDPRHLVVTVVGDVDTEAVLARVRAAFGSLEARDDAFAMPERAAVAEGPRQATKTIDRKQSHIVLAWQGVDVANEDRFPLSVLETVLSGQGGRLFYELRDKQALAYSVTAFSAEGLAPGIFGAYIACDPDNAQRAIDGLGEELDKVRANEIRPDELSRAQRYLSGNHAIALQSNAAIAENMTFNELYGLGFDADGDYADKIEAVTPADVLRVARKYLAPETQSLVVVGPAETRLAAAQ